MSKELKLNQILAIEKSVKSNSYERLTDSHRLMQKGQLFSGISRSYLPIEEDGQSLPPESTLVQQRAKNIIADVVEDLNEYLDVVATKDYANCNAKADVEVDGQVLFEEAPVSYLLFLEKQLQDYKSFVKKMPVLDPSEEWHFDDNQNCYATSPVETSRTKKIPRNHVKAEATEHHPAQVEVYHEDKVVGLWKTMKYSGALSVKDRTNMLSRVEKVLKAVKQARERANSQEIERLHVADTMLNYIFKV